ncbi:MAG: sigma-54-dependent Fis family transcriptional regulator [Bacteroidales bacterium]|nr:sigma-54-dependent Fis family transcriptional regulator [Bacteroidales bacterium]
MIDIQSIKQRFGIIGLSPQLDRAIDIVRQVAPTDLTVLITGESGTGKEIFPKIIHQFSSRKHGPFIAVNCGAIPEGTIDSELFGHEKGSFTGAHEARKGYFEVANTGTIFLDEVAELPLSTQVRLLRVLESGEFMRVGSSKVIKTDVRLVAATNVNLSEAISNGKFREDLYYRLNTVPVQIPPLRQRKDDIVLLFRKFAADVAEKYRMPVLELNEEATQVLKNYRWSGNVRQLKNIAEQISIIEEKRMVSPEVLQKYLQDQNTSDLPVLYKQFGGNDSLSERDLLYKVLFDMKKDMTEMKRLVAEIIAATGIEPDDDVVYPRRSNDRNDFEKDTSLLKSSEYEKDIIHVDNNDPYQKEDIPIDYHEEIEETLSLEKKEKEMIIRALEKHGGRRKNAAAELGISERTLYRKIKEYEISQ